MRAVDGKRRLIGPVIGFGSCRACAVINQVPTGNDSQLFGVNRRVDVDRAGDKPERGSVFNIHTCACDINRSGPVNIERDVAAPHLRHTGGQRGSRRVDEPTAGTGDAVGVGEDNLGAAPEDFGHAFQLRPVGARHFVEDETCFPPF